MSEKVIARVRAWIAGSGLTDGARLPPERELCTTLGLSRAELRKAFLVLETNGVLDRQVGRGTFLVRKSEKRKSGLAKDIIATLSERTGPHEAMTARLALEPVLAKMAALHASPAQLRELRRLSTAMRNSVSWTAYEEMDSQFHDILAEASGNSLLYELHKIMNRVRFVVVWRRLNTPAVAPDPGYHSFDEHDAIVLALEVRDGKRAFEAMQAHLESTLSTMTVDT